MNQKFIFMNQFLNEYNLEINQNLQLNPVLNNKYGADYEFYNLNVYDINTILVIVKIFDQKSIKLIEESKKNLEKYFNKIVIFYFDNLDSNYKYRLIQKRVNFIAENKQICIFDLLINFETHHHKIINNLENKLQFIPQSQLFLIYFLQKNKEQNLECKSYKALAPIINCTPMTITNIMNNFQLLNLIEISGTKEKYFNFKYNSQEIYNVSLRNNFFINPHYSTYYVDHLPPNEVLVIAENSVLNYYMTNFNDFSNATSFAIDKLIFYDFLKNNMITPNKTHGKYKLYVLKYNPKLTSIEMNGNSIIDPISFFLIYNDIIEHKEFYLNHIKKHFLL